MSNLSRRWNLAIGAILIAGALTSAAIADEKTARDLALARLELARKAYAYLDEDLKNPPAATPEEQQRRFREIVEQATVWSRRWMKAEIDAGTRPGDRATAIEAHIKRLKKWEDVLTELAKGEAWGVSQRNVDLLRYHRLKAEYLLAKTKR